MEINPRVWRNLKKQSNPNIIAQLAGAVEYTGCIR